MNLALEGEPAEHAISRPYRRNIFTGLTRYHLIRLLHGIGSLCLVAALSAAVYFAISRFFLTSVEVVGVSMVPTLQEHGRYMLNRIAYRDHEPVPQDIVVIIDPGDHGYSVKRVIAKPGDSVLFKNGSVYVNGDLLREPYLAPGTYTFLYSKNHEQMITLGHGQYFVLGDNRTKSVDSRSYGPVPRENILGQVLVKNG